MRLSTAARPAVARSAAALRDLQQIPGIGPSLAKDLFDLGITRVTELRGRDPQRLYEQLCALRGQHQDRCVLYTFRCAVYYTSEKEPDPERLKWWNWTDAERANNDGPPAIARPRAPGATA